MRIFSEKGDGSKMNRYLRGERIVKNVFSLFRYQFLFKSLQFNAEISMEYSLSTFRPRVTTPRSRSEYTSFCLHVFRLRLLSGPFTHRFIRHRQGHAHPPRFHTYLLLNPLDAVIRPPDRARARILYDTNLSYQDL